MALGFAKGNKMSNKTRRRIKRALKARRFDEIAQAKSLVYVSYNVFRASGDFSSSPELREYCSCNGWDTHICIHCRNAKEALQLYNELYASYSDEMESRQIAMSR